MPLQPPMNFRQLNCLNTCEVAGGSGAGWRYTRIGGVGQHRDRWAGLQYCCTGPLRPVGAIATRRKDARCYLCGSRLRRSQSDKCPREPQADSRSMGCTVACRGVRPRARGTSQVDRPSWSRHLRSRAHRRRVGTAPRSSCGVDTRLISSSTWVRITRRPVEGPQLSQGRPGRTPRWPAPPP